MFHFQDRGVKPYPYGKPQVKIRLDVMKHWKVQPPNGKKPKVKSIK